MSEQLALGLPAPRPAKKPKPERCKCGHFKDEHKDGAGRCAPCKDVVDTLRAEMGALAKGQAKLCARFRSKARKPPPTPLELLGPAGSFPIWRPDTVHPKPMGWAAIEEVPIAYAGEDIACPFVKHEARWTFYLAQVKAERPNTFMRFGNDPKLAQRIQAGMKKRFTDQAERASAAIEQIAAKEGIEPGELELPREVTLTRVSFGKCDSDALSGSLKWIRDAVAETLGFDDFAFVVRHDSDAREPPDGRVWLRYEQGHSYKAGVFGVRIEVAWRAV
jgi:hypothetical protein